MANSPIQGFKITVNHNFVQTQKDWDALIQHIRDSASNPININVNTSQINQQVQKMVQETNNATKQLETQIADGFSSRIQTESEKLAKATEQAKRALNISLQGLETKYGSLLPTTQVEQLKSAISGLKGESLSELRTNVRDVRLDMGELTNQARASSSALRIANQDAKSFGSTILADATKFGLAI